MNVSDRTGTSNLRILLHYNLDYIFRFPSLHSEPPCSYITSYSSSSSSVLTNRNDVRLLNENAGHVKTSIATENNG